MVVRGPNLSSSDTRNKSIDLNAQIVGLTGKVAGRNEDFIGLVLRRSRRFLHISDGMNCFYRS